MHDGADAATRVAQGVDRVGLDVGLEDATLELDGAEAVGVDHPAGLGNDGRGVERLAVAIGLAPGVAGPFVEEVGRVRHARAHGAAQEVRDGTTKEVSLRVEAGDLETGKDAQCRARRVDLAGEAASIGAHGAR